MSLAYQNPADLHAEDNLPPILPMAILAHLPDGVLIIDAKNSNIVWSNETAAKLFGLKIQDFFHKNILEFEQEFFGTQKWPRISALTLEKGEHLFFSRKTQNNRVLVSIETHIRHYIENGENYFLAILRDIKKRISIEQNEQTRNHRLWFAMNESFDGMWDWEVQTGEVFLSPRMKRILGYSGEQTYTAQSIWHDNIHPDDKEKTLAGMEEHLEQHREHYEAEYRLRIHTGEYLWIHDRRRVCERDANGRPLRVVGVLQNITERKNLELSLHDMALHDALTGLPNRHKAENFFKYLVQNQNHAEKPQTVCVAIIDLDFFKRINDVYGHPVGDKILIIAGHLFRKNLRAKDFVARWGGEEFLIVLPETDLKTARLVVSRIFADFCQNPWEREAGVPHVSFSMGLTQTNLNPEHDFYHTVTMADRALYEAKSTGRSRCVIIEENGKFRPMALA